MLIKANDALGPRTKVRRANTREELSDITEIDLLSGVFKQVRRGEDGKIACTPMVPTPEGGFRREIIIDTVTDIPVVVEIRPDGAD